MKLTMRDIARSGHVTRWHSVRTARDQTLAEHAYMVTMISREIAKQVYGDKLTCEDLLLLLEYSLDHDTPELVSGDLASPMKRKIEEICASNGMESPIDAIENEIAPHIAEMKERMDATPLPYIAKIADLIDALIFINVEKGFDAHAKVVIEKLEQMYETKLSEAEKRFPQLNWKAVHEIYDEMLNGTDNQIEFELHD